MKGGAVYFIKALDGNAKSPVKIGITKDIVSRINGIQTGCPYKLQVMAWIESENYILIEKFLHKYLENKRMNGEWFLIDTDEVREICKTFNRILEVVTC